MVDHVFAAFPQPRHMPCTECGASVVPAAAAGHECDLERMLDYCLLQLRDEIAAFDEQLTGWLASPGGQFATWLAERGR